MHRRAVKPMHTPEPQGNGVPAQQISFAVSFYLPLPGTCSRRGQHVLRISLPVKEKRHDSRRNQVLRSLHQRYRLPNRVREVTPREGSPFWSVTIAALRGSADAVRYTYFECRVVGKRAQDLVRELQSAVDGQRKVLVGFVLSDLFVEAYTHRRGDRNGDPGASLKARLLRISWASIDGEPFYKEQAA